MRTISSCLYIGVVGGGRCSARLAQYIIVTSWWFMIRPFSVQTWLVRLNMPAAPLSESWLMAVWSLLCILLLSCYFILSVLSARIEEKTDKACSHVLCGRGHWNRLCEDHYINYAFYCTWSLRPEQVCSALVLDNGQHWQNIRSIHVQQFYFECVVNVFPVNYLDSDGPQQSNLSRHSFKVFCTRHRCIAFPANYMQWPVAREPLLHSRTAPRTF